jgi:3-oxoacid CoA-transferase subunit A
VAAMSGRITIAEVEELVDTGDLDPNDIHTPGVYVHRVVALTPEQAAEKRIERVTVRPRPDRGGTASPAGATNEGR